MYDDFSIELARKRGAPDPEGNAARANRVLDVLRDSGPEPARALLVGITDPEIRGSLSNLIECRAGWSCIIP